MSQVYTRNKVKELDFVSDLDSSIVSIIRSHLCAQSSVWEPWLYHDSYTRIGLVWHQPLLPLQTVTYGNTKDIRVCIAIQLSRLGEFTSVIYACRGVVASSPVKLTSPGSIALCREGEKKNWQNTRILLFLSILFIYLFGFFFSFHSSFCILEPPSPPCCPVLVGCIANT